MPPLAKTRDACSCPVLREISLEEPFIKPSHASLTSLTRRALISSRIIGSTDPTTGTFFASPPLALSTSAANGASTHATCRTNFVTRLGLSHTTANVTMRASPRATSPLHALHRALPVGATDKLYRFGCAFIAPQVPPRKLPARDVCLPCISSRYPFILLRRGACWARGPSCRGRP